MNHCGFFQLFSWAESFHLQRVVSLKKDRYYLERNMPAWQRNQTTVDHTNAPFTDQYAP